MTWTDTGSDFPYWQQLNAELQVVLSVTLLDCNVVGQESCHSWCRSGKKLYLWLELTSPLQPNGSLGPSVISHLQKAGFDITLLTRDVEKAS